jgi:hypothetical protein
MKKLDEMRSKSAELVQATEALSERLEIIESKLVELDMGVSADYPLYGDSSEPALAFKRRGDGWGLFVIASNGDHTPLRSASRNDRTLAAKVLPDLIGRMCDLVDQKRLEVDQAIAKSDEVIEIIKAAAS